jgi:hypothetical protein
MVGNQDGCQNQKGGGEMSTELVQAEKVAAELTPLTARVFAMEIREQADRDAAVIMVKEVKAAQKRIADFCDPKIKSAKATYDLLRNEKTQLIGPFEQAERTLKSKVLDYDAERERKRQAELRRLQAEADEQARKEREKALKAAEKLKTPELKQERIEQAEQIAAPVIELAPAVEKQKGEVKSVRWSAELVDIDALIKAAASGNGTARGLLAFDNVAANKLAIALKENLDVPGVKAVSKTTMGMRI